MYHFPAAPPVPPALSCCVTSRFPRLCHHPAVCHHPPAPPMCHQRRRAVGGGGGGLSLTPRSPLSVSQFDYGLIWADQTPQLPTPRRRAAAAAVQGGRSAADAVCWQVAPLPPVWSGLVRHPVPASVVVHWDGLHNITAWTTRSIAHSQT